MEEPMEEGGQEIVPKQNPEEEKKPAKVTSILRPGSMGKCRPYVFSVSVKPCGVNIWSH